MKVERIKLKLLFLPVMLLIMACTGSKTHEPSASDKVDTLVATPAFNGDSAFAFVVAQCDFGPRVPGSTAHDACAEWIKQQFASFGMLVTEHQATVRGYDGAQMLCRNIISRIKERRLKAGIQPYCVAAQRPDIGQLFDNTRKITYAVTV